MTNLIVVTFLVLSSSAYWTIPLRHPNQSQAPQDPTSLRSLQQPEVDLMWSIIPDEIIETNFGKKVRKQFLGIEVYIGNKTSQSILIEGIVFKSTTGQSLPVTGLTAVSPLAKHREDRHLCSMVFDRELLVRSNYQMKTVVFLARSLISNPIMRTADDARRLRNEIGDLEVTVSKVAEEKVILRTTSQIAPM